MIIEDVRVAGSTVFIKGWFNAEHRETSPKPEHIRILMERLVQGDENIEAIHSLLTLGVLKKIVAVLTDKGAL